MSGFMEGGGEIVESGTWGGVWEVVEEVDLGSELEWIRKEG